jgi:hypothetical protein
MKRGRNLRRVELGLMSSTSTSSSHKVDGGWMLIDSGLTWDEANLALTEIQKDSLMSVQLARLEWKLTGIGRLMNPRLLM